MFMRVWKVISCILILSLSLTANASSPWGKNYFPNTELITQEGKKVYFFDDLIDGKIVAINFIYTSCPDVCPLETAQLVKVQKIMGDRVGNDIHFYSISIDPETDTPERLKEYRKRFGAKWTFLTGDKQEIVHLRRKLGLYIDGVDDGPNKNNHNVSMIIGNQKTGRWMKRSPFENPYVLADQLGNWLTGWKSPQKNKDYDKAPELRALTRGEPLFRTRCSSCHSVDGNEQPDAIGPDLAGVTQRRDINWLLRWLQAPDKMIAQKDPIAMQLLKQYNNLPMPNLRLNKQEALELIEYMGTLKVPGQKTPPSNDHDHAGHDHSAHAHPAKTSDVNAEKTFGELKVTGAWIREAHPNATVNAGYFILSNNGKSSVEIVSASSDAFEMVEFHEMAMADGMMEMRELTDIVVGAGESLELRTGGKHLMLKEPKRRLKDGDQVELLLTFKSGKTISMRLPVRKDF